MLCCAPGLSAGTLSPLEAAGLWSSVHNSIQSPRERQDRLRVNPHPSPFVHCTAPMPQLMCCVHRAVTLWTSDRKLNCNDPEARCQEISPGAPSKGRAPRILLYPDLDYLINVSSKLAFRTASKLLAPVGPASQTVPIRTSFKRCTFIAHRVWTTKVTASFLKIGQYPNFLWASKRKRHPQTAGSSFKRMITHSHQAEWVGLGGGCLLLF